MFSCLCFEAFPWDAKECSVVYVLRHFLGMPWNVQCSTFYDISLGCHRMYCVLCFVTFLWVVIECSVFSVL